VRAAAAIVLVLLAVAAGATLSSPRTPAPPQPMPFSHRVHAGEQQIGCTTCHAWADRAAVAGIPSVARCLGCHKFVRQDPKRPALAEALRPLVAKLRERPTTPIAWTRVHRLPDHVSFAHAPHVRAGLPCRECHGEVEKMDEVRQVSSLEMGWCLACHRRRQAERPRESLAHLTDCLTCHG
jgi:hypothetical protein